MGSRSALFLPTASCFPLAISLGNLSIFLPQLICPQIRSKYLLCFLKFACSIFVSDLSLSLLPSMPAAPGVMALSAGEVSLSGWFGCGVNARGLALPSSTGSGQKEGWHLGRQAQAHALTSESKEEASYFSCWAGPKRGSEKVQQPGWV